MTGLRPVGAFPQTPARPKRAAMENDGTPEPPRRSTGNNLPVAPQQHQAAPGATAPLIPLNVIDAPTQRFYALAIYIALFAWKFYDWAGLVEENSESFWLFLKWIAIDCVFLFGLPELRIPWLELSQPFVVALFFCHAIFDWMLMFNVGVCSLPPGIAASWKKLTGNSFHGKDGSSASSACFTTASSPSLSTTSRFPTSSTTRP